MRTRLRGKFSLLFLTFAVLLAIPAIALADIVATNADATVDTTVESKTMAVGGTTTVGYFIQNQNEKDGDTLGKCNTDDGSSATVTINTPAGVTATPGSLTFSGNCGVIQNASFTSEKAGTYTITVGSVSDSGTGSYSVQEATWSLTVTKANTSLVNVSGSGHAGASDGSLTATLKNTSVTPNKNVSGKDVTFKIDGNAVPGTATTNASGVATLNNVDLSTFSSATTKPMTANFAGTNDNDYAGSSGSGTLTVAAPLCSAPSVTSHPSNQSITYGANATFTADASGTPAPNVKWQVLGTGSGATWTDVPNETNKTLTLTKPSVADSGKQYRAVFTNTCNGTKTATSDPATLTVGAKQITITPDSGQSKVYGDENDPTLTYKASSALESGDSFTGALDRAEGENVDPYAINLGTLSAGNNYNLNLSNTTVNFSITARPITVTPDTGQSKVYGDNDPTLAFHLANGTTLGFTDTLDDATNGALSRVSGESVAGGPYAIQQGSLVATSNYSLTFDANNVTFAITPRPITVTADPQTKTYGDADPELTYKVTSGNLVGADEFDGSLARDEGENVSTYAINQGTLTAGANYKLTYVGANLVIDPATLTVNANNATTVYGDSPTLTPNISGFKFGENEGTAAGLLGEASCSLTSAAGTDVGSYPNAIECTKGTLAATNYVFANGTTKGTLTITARPITVTPDSGQSKVYGNSDPTLTFGLANGTTLASGDTLDDATDGALSRASGESVAGGPYAIQQGSLVAAANGNYTLNFDANNVTFAITARPIAVTPDSGQSKVYGNSDPALTFGLANNTTLGFTDTLDDATNGALSRVSGESVAGGPYAIQQGSLVATSNYTLNFVGNGVTFAITPRPITVTPDSGQSKVYGTTPDPTLTFHLANNTTLGFNDTLADATDGALSRASGESVAGGPYAITQGSLVAAGPNPSNYTLSFDANNATFAITPKGITVTADNKTKQLGATDPALTYTVPTGSLAFNDTPASVFSGSLTRDAGETVAGSPYTIRQGTLSANSNYTISTFNNGTLTIVYGSGFVGIQQPINGGMGESIALTANSVGPGADPDFADDNSRFKLGSTIPVKFELRNASGTLVSNASAQLFLKKADSNPDPGVDEAVSTAASTTGNLFRYDATSGQYIFNLSTKNTYLNPNGTSVPMGVGTYTLTVKLDDGTTRSVNFNILK